MRLIYERTETIISITIKGHGDPTPYVRRLMELVEPTVCAECLSVIPDGEPVEQRDDGADLCRDCYERLYAEREDRVWQTGDFLYDWNRER